MSKPMKVLSLSRPWPWAIFDIPAPNAKTIENRSWLPPYDVIGEYIALHAAKSWDDKAIPFFESLGLSGWPARFEQHPFGVILGIARVDRAITDPNKLTKAQRRWFFENRTDGKDNVGWVLTDVKKLREPVEQKGAQGLRFLTPAIADRVRELAA